MQIGVFRNRGFSCDDAADSLEQGEGGDNGNHSDEFLANSHNVGGTSEGRWLWGRAGLRRGGRRWGTGASGSSGCAVSNWVRSSH